MRLSDTEALDLLARAPIHELGARADAARAQRFPSGEVTYLIDRNINYTNICAATCVFCAFKRDPGDETEGYLLDKSEMAEKVREARDLGATSVLLQGGLHPDLRLDYYVDLVRFFRSLDIHVHGFSAPEIHFLARLERKSHEEILSVLVDAGLGSLPGGGAEILVDASRKVIAKGKCLTNDWLSVHRAAHRLGLRSSATMMFGTGEPLAWIVEHLRRLRELQDESLSLGSDGFTAFIPWTMQPKNTALEGVVAPATSVEYLRVLAVSRLYLDNVAHIQSSWVTQGDKVCQVGLRFGADDFGSLMIEENVVRAAGAAFHYSLEEIVWNIRAAGFEPVRRTILYERLPEFSGRSRARA